MFVKKNEEKLSTSQTAQRIVNFIEFNITKNDLTPALCPEFNCVLDENGLEIISGQQISSVYNISADFTASVEDLVKVKVTITDNDDPESSSETFTYIRR